MQFWSVKEEACKWQTSRPRKSDKRGYEISDNNCYEKYGLIEKEE